jgi:hypothetical protein
VFIVRKFLIAHGDESNVLQEGTALIIVEASESNRVPFFFVKEGSSEEHAVVASELALCCHNVKHSLS